MINNIFQNAARNGLSVYSVDADSLSGFESRNNLAFNAGYSGSWLPFISTEIGAILNTDPLLIGSTALSISNSSPAVNTGSYLTKVAPSDTGTGSSLIVEESGYFQDGWAAVSPDWIAIGTPTNIAQIVSINHSNNTITLDRTLNRSVGNLVWLYKDSNGKQVLYGSAPDIGSYETTVSVLGAVNGACGIVINGCSAGSFTDLPDNSLNALWNCAGSNGGATASCTLPLTSTSQPDTTSPTVSITSPAAGSTISGAISLSASAADPVVAGQTTSGIASVQFKVDGVNIPNSFITNPPYSGLWTTSGVTNGNHIITAVATDRVGRITTSNGVSVTVSNTSTNPITNPASTTTSTNTSTTSSKGTFAPTVAQPKTNTVGSATSTATTSTSRSAGDLITKSLTFGTSDPQILILQQLLNLNGYTIKVSGTGSPGNESSYFGIATQEAVKKFQCDKGIVCGTTQGVGGYGLVGPKTIAALNALSKRPGGVTTSNSVIPSSSNTTPPPPVSTGSATFTRILRFGSRGQDVKNLQIFLNTHGFVIAETGGGSPGNETTYFGMATKNAVIKFQEANREKILTPLNLQNGTGNLGRSTIRVVEELIGGKNQ